MLFSSVSAPTAYISFHGTSASAPLVSMLSIDLVELVGTLRAMPGVSPLVSRPLSSSHLSCRPSGVTRQCILIYSWAAPLEQRRRLWLLFDPVGRGYDTLPSAQHS
jgi:hypothetical protein